jgi:hypothetical protein
LPVTFNSWVNESDVILIVKVGSDLLGDLDESLESESVGKIFVQVVLVMLKLVHLLHGVIVVADLWEREGFVIELLGGDGELGEDSLLLKLFLDEHSVVPVFHLEVSGELTKLVMHLILSELKRRWAILSSRVELHKRVELLLVVSNAKGASSGHAGKKYSEFHN